MKKSRFSLEQIAKILKDYDTEITSEELCKLNGISRQLFINGAVNMPVWNQVI